MAIKTLKLELCLLPSSYYQKRVLKENSYLYPVLIEDSPLVSKIEIISWEVQDSPKINEMPFSIDAKPIEITITTTIFRRNETIEEQPFSIQALPNSIEIINTIFPRNYKDNEGIFSINAKPVEIIIENTLVPVGTKQTEEDSFSIEAKPVEITIME